MTSTCNSLVFNTENMTFHQVIAQDVSLEANDYLSWVHIIDIATILLNVNFVEYGKVLYSFTLYVVFNSLS